MVSDVRSGWQASVQSGLDACSRYDYQSGRECFSKALEQAGQEGAPEHSIGEIFFNLGWCHQALGDLSGAEEKYKQALERVERCYGHGSDPAVKVLQQLSSMYRSVNRTEEAEACAARAAGSGPQQPPAAPSAPAPAPPQAAPEEPKPPSRAGIVMDKVPVATQNTGYIAGSMFKEKPAPADAKPAQPAAEQPPAGPPAQLPPSAPPPPPPVPAPPPPPVPASPAPPPSPPSQPAAPSASAPVEPHAGVQIDQERAAPKRRGPRLIATATGAEDSDYDEIISEAGESQGPFVIEDLIHPREKLYSKVSGAVGCMIYFVSCICMVGLVIAPLALLGAFIAHGLLLGNLRGNGVRVSNRQFPEVQKILERYCTIMRMEIPEVIIVNGDGLLNAFANRLHRKDMIIISSNVLEMAYEQGERELAFVVVHELAHVKLGHVKWGWLHIPGHMIPFLGSAYSRACEYSCDRIARHLVPDGALFGLVALAAGTKLYRNVNLKALYEQAEQDWGFWTWFYEIQASHPNLVNRIRAIGIKDAEVKRRASKGKE